MKRGYLLLIAFVALLAVSCSSGEQPTVHRLDYRRLSRGETGDFGMVLDGVTYSSWDAFINVVAKLPPRSRLMWYSGCVAFEEMPPGPAPRMSISEFTAFCRRHRIRFDYQCGLISDPLVEKAFSVSRPFVPERADARPWLEAQGVTFSPKAAARWDAQKQILTVRNTEENIELVARILELTKPQ